MNLREIVKQLEREDKIEEFQKLLDRASSPDLVSRAESALAPLLKYLTEAIQELQGAQRETNAMLEAIAQKDTTVQFPKVQRVEVTNHAKFPEVQIPDVKFPAEYKLAEGSPDNRQYVVLVNEEGRPIDLTKLFQPAREPSRLGAMFRGGVSLITDSSADGTLSGAIDGSNQTFTLRYTPKEGSEKVYVQGMRFTKTEDYTITGRVITMNTAPPAGPIAVDYQKQ